MAVHTLKTLAPYWDAIADGSKRFEVRRDDRGFQRGDTLKLARMCDDEPSVYSTPGGGKSSHAQNADTLFVHVDWVLTGGQLGIEPGYVVMSITIQA